MRKYRVVIECEEESHIFEVTEFNIKDAIVLAMQAFREVAAAGKTAMNMHEYWIGKVEVVP